MHIELPTVFIIKYAPYVYACQANEIVVYTFYYSAATHIEANAEGGYCIIIIIMT